MDSEKVLKGLECHSKKLVCFGNCPYYDGTGDDSICTSNLAFDAFELVKGLTEQEQKWLQKIKEIQRPIRIDEAHSPWWDGALFGLEMAIKVMTEMH